MHVRNSRSLNVEVQRSFLTMINAVRRSEVKSFARSVIEFVCDPVALSLRQGFHARSLG